MGKFSATIPSGIDDHQRPTADLRTFRSEIALLKLEIRIQAEDRDRRSHVGAGFLGLVGLRSLRHDNARNDRPRPSAVALVVIVRW